MKFTNGIYAHEHICLDLSTKERPNRILNDIKATIYEFKKLKEQGITKIIDVTASGMGRNPEYIKKVMEETGLEITIATGYYKEPYLPQCVYELSYQNLAKKMIQEIEVGIDDTNIKASVIGEIGSSKDKITEIETKVFIAGCFAHNDSGIPIVTHTTLATMALEQLAIFNKYNIDLSKVVISHMDLSPSLEYIIKVLDSGVNIGFDTIGKNNYNLDKTRAEFLIELCNRGYEKQIVMALDITANAQLKNQGGIGYNYLFESFFPLLLKLGLKKNYIKIIMEDNPNRIFARSFLNAK